MLEWMYLLTRYADSNLYALFLLSVSSSLLYFHTSSPKRFCCLAFRLTLIQCQVLEWIGIIFQLMLHFLASSVTICIQRTSQY